jgi:RimJ/RimL family protein N-acetyltransferase
MEDASFERLLTARLVLRRFRPEDVDAFAAYRSDPEVARYQGWDAPYSREEAEAFVASLTGLGPGRPGTWFQFAVAPRAGAPLLGDCALRTSRRDPRRGELGFTFARAHQGRGYATEAAAAVLAYAFGTLGMARVEAVIDTRNRRAAHLLERLGLACEGALPAPGGGGSGGAATRELVYAALAATWRPPARIPGADPW